MPKKSNLTYNRNAMEKLRMEYQKMMYQTTRFYATLCLALIAFFTTHIINLDKNSPVLLMVAGILLMSVAATWRWKIESWNELLRADIEYNKIKLPGYKEYNEFIYKEIENSKIRKKHKFIAFPNFMDDLLPRIMLTVSFMITLSGAALCVVLSTIDVLKIFK